MNYKVLDGGALFNIVGVRLENKNFLFWKLKGNNFVNKVKVIFDKNLENIEVLDGEVILSLKDFTEFNELRNAIVMFFRFDKHFFIINANDIQIEFVVSNDMQINLASALGKDLGIRFSINNVDEKNKVQKVEERLENSSSIDGNDMIEKYDNNQYKKITIHDGSAYENNGILDSEEEKLSLLRQWRRDPVMFNKLNLMSESEIDKLLSDYILSNRKQYRLEDADKKVANDKASSVSVEMAKNIDGRVNTELNIIQNKQLDDKKYMTVEKKGDDVSLVSPNVISTIINVDGRNDTIVKKENISGVDKIFYVDEESNILDDNYVAVGKLGYQGYQINYEDNSLVRYGEKVGVIDDYKNIGKTFDKVNTKKKVLEKDDNEKSGGFVTIAVIMFVLSALFLVGSLILLFVLE